MRGLIGPPCQTIISSSVPGRSVRWDARSDRVPPLQTIIFSSFPGRTQDCRPLAQNASFLAFHTANLDSWLLGQNLVSVLRRTGSADSVEALAQLLCVKSWPLEGGDWSPFFSSLSLSGILLLLSMLRVKKNVV